MLIPARIISLEHLFLVPLALLALYLIKMGKRGAWIISFVEALAAFWLTRILTNPEYNVNYAFKSIFPPDAGGDGYFFRWLFYVLSMIIVTNFIINKIPIFRKK